MKRSIFFLLILSILLLGACRSTEEAPGTASATAVPEPVVAEEIAATAVPQPTATEEPTAEPSPTPVQEVVLDEIISEEVRIEAEDGLMLQATFSAANGLENAPGVILLHMLDDNRKVWENTGVTEELAANGYAVLALDMRGHGETGGGKDWLLAEDDLQRVWRYFADRPEVDEEKTAVIGGSIGSNMALIAAANEPAIRTAILLSPGLDYRGVTTENRLADYGERPLLIVASENDGYSADSSNTLAETAVGETQLELYKSAGHGTRMFTAEPTLMPLILTWLNQHLTE